MEQSVAYKAKLQRVRSLPQETPQESQEKRRDARLFRMEVILDNANCARLLTRTLETDPNTSPDEYIKRAGNSSMVAHPEVVESFVDNLIHTRMRTLDAVDSLKKDAANNQTGQAKMLYKWNLPTKEFGRRRWRPKGRVQVDKSYPLAVTLVVDDPKDFARIDTRSNVGGFYNPERNYGHFIGRWPHEQGSRIIADTFPVIVINGSSASIGINHHEQGHGENYILQKAFKQVEMSGGRKVVWASYKDSSITYTDILQLEQVFLTDETLATTSPAWNTTVQYALERAKDELLAEMKAESMSPRMLHHLLQRGGNYDYFRKDFSIHPTSPLYEAMWQEYAIQLNRAVNTIIGIRDVYEEYQLYDRQDLFRWVLAQIPLAKWNEQLEGSLFIEEAARLGKIADFMEAKNNQPISSRDDPDETHPFTMHDFLQLHKAFKTLEARCQTSQREPLFDPIEEFERYIEENFDANQADNSLS